MSHHEQRFYVQKISQRFPFHFTNKHVLDVGSLDINGNNRWAFTDWASYTGIDIAPGINVDVVSKGHEYDPGIQYETIISTECFEHDKYYEQTLQNIVRLLKPGGMFIFTCATTGRAEHGTVNSDIYSSPLTCNIEDWASYYKNLTEEDIRKAINVEEIFSEFEFEVNGFTHDLYFYGIKK